ncbi:MAG: hypothetical protein JW809_10505 [Pirellulales bacterium]|nr:hypothetical protein [Pirellulales bacterium]
MVQRARCRLSRPPCLASVLAALALSSLLAAAGRSIAAEPSAVVHYDRPVLIRFEGVITGSLAAYLARKLDAARDTNADLVILEIDSPGGRVDASLDSADRLVDVDWARTVAYVPREALSGAAIVALGCDEIVMAPEAALGDAGPIYQAEGFQFRHAPEKSARILHGECATWPKPTAALPRWPRPWSIWISSSSA